MLSGRRPHQGLTKREVRFGCAHVRRHVLWAQPDRLLCVFGGTGHIGELQRDSGAVGVVCRLRKPRQRCAGQASRPRQSQTLRGDSRMASVKAS
jgi:hypothetical protein